MTNLLWCYSTSPSIDWSIHLINHIMGILWHWNHLMGQQRNHGYMRTSRPRMLVSGCLYPLTSAILSSKAFSSKSPWYRMLKLPCPRPWPRFRSPGFGTCFLTVPSFKQSSPSSWKLLRLLTTKCWLVWKIREHSTPCHFWRANWGTGSLHT